MRKLFLFLFILTFTACAIFQPSEYDWKQQILRWQNFKLEGLIEVNYKSFSLRKNIVIEKQADAGKLNIFQSGLFGLAPQPLISASYQNGKLKVNNLPPESAAHIPITEIDMIFNLDQIAQKAKLKGNVAFFEEYVINFENGRLSSLVKNNRKIEFKYQGEQPVEIIFIEKKQEIGKIIIDNINFRRGRT